MSAGKEPDWSEIRLLALDVDGVLTDGRIHLAAGPDGEIWELKSFHVRDGLGISRARSAGLQVAWITGRSSPLVTRRAEELGVLHVHQGVADKASVLTELQSALVITPAETAYVGDDLNDLPAFTRAGLRIAVADAAEGLRTQADWITTAAGGHGAVREVIDRWLALNGADPAPGSPERQ